MPIQSNGHSSRPNSKMIGPRSSTLATSHCLPCIFIVREIAPSRFLQFTTPAPMPQTRANPVRVWEPRGRHPLQVAQQPVAVALLDTGPPPTSGVEYQHHHNPDHVDRQQIDPVTLG